MKFKKTSSLSLIVTAALIFFAALVCHAAYNHNGDIDSSIFRTVYPDVAGTKLDSCNVCHSGGSYVSGDKTITLGSCQWCHYKTDYGKDLSEATLLTTLNPYGTDYIKNGRGAGALQAINGIDSDGDNFTNQAEIVAETYPGDAMDDPTKVPAPFRVISLDEFEDMPLHSQFLLMNASKSDDSYSEYSGIALENLVKAIMLDSATGITVYSPDGFSTYHPFQPSDNSSSYHVFGIYPPGIFYYNQRADIAWHHPDPPKYLEGGWCDYSSPLVAGRANESVIFNSEGLKLVLAFKRDGEYLAPGVLNLQNKLDGEGPFRVIPPQKIPGWPDQRSSSKNQSVDWPYNENADHNAGFSSRTVTMVRVEPLPAGTTDINTLEAGWPYVDEKKIVIYGSINPYPLENLNRSLEVLIGDIKSKPDKAFKAKSSKIALVNKIEAIEKQVAAGAYSAALIKLKNDVLKKMDGYLSGAVDDDDWIKDINVEQQLCFEIQKIWVMLVIIGA
jgi:hypothetical protein